MDEAKAKMYGKVRSRSRVSPARPRCAPFLSRNEGYFLRHDDSLLRHDPRGLSRALGSTVPRRAR